MRGLQKRKFVTTWGSCFIKHICAFLSVAHFSWYGVAICMQTENKYIVPQVQLLHYLCNQPFHLISTFTAHRNGSWKGGSHVGGHNTICFCTDQDLCVQKEALKGWNTGSFFDYLTLRSTGDPGYRQLATFGPSSARTDILFNYFITCYLISINQCQKSFKLCIFSVIYNLIKCHSPYLQGLEK